MFADPPGALLPLLHDLQEELGRVDDAAVVQMYADGFAELSLREKTLVWHLYQAALAGTAGFVELPPGPNTYPKGFVTRLYRW